MVRREDQCVGCPPEMGCLGPSCPYRDVPVLICDCCGEEVYDLYLIDGEQYCADCLLQQFEKVEVD